MPRIYREMPLNSIWEGSGNVMCLDVLRAMQRTPEAVPAFFAELKSARGGDRRLDAFVRGLEDELTDQSNIESRARRVVEKMALAVQGALLVKDAPAAVADAFCASRLERDWGGAFGTLPPGVDARAIAARALPN